MFHFRRRWVGRYWSRVLSGHFRDLLSQTALPVILAPGLATGATLSLVGGGGDGGGDDGGWREFD